MPTRSRHARNTKKSTPPHPQLHADGSSTPNSTAGTPASLSADATPYDSHLPSPALQLPTPLPEPAERLVGRRATQGGLEVDATALEGGPMEEELIEESVPQVGFAVEQAEEDILGRLIDFDHSSPSSPPRHTQFLVDDNDIVDHDHQASLSGFLNDHLDAPVDGHDNPVEFGRSSYQVQEAYTYPDGGEGGESETTTYRSPPFIEAPLPPEFDAPLPAAQDEEALPVPPPVATPTTTKTRKKSKKREAKEREAARERDLKENEEMGRHDVRGTEEQPVEEAYEREGVPVVAPRISSRTSSSSHSRSSSLNPPSLIPDLSSPSTSSTFSSLSKTIRSYAPSVPLTLPSPRSQKGAGKGAPYPPLVSRPVVSGRVESGAKSPSLGGYDDDDEGVDGRQGYGYGYGYSKSPPATMESFLPPTFLSRPSSSASASRPATRSTTTTSRATSTVPERQGAWPEYAQPSRRGDEGVSRHRSTKSQGSQAGLGTLASGLTQTLRGADNFGLSQTASSLVVPTRGRESQQGVYPRQSEAEDVERVVWARWDTLTLASVGEGKRMGRMRRTDVLVVGYEKALRVWDVGNLGSVAEVLHVKFGAGRDGVVDGDEEEEEGMWVRDGESVDAVVKAVVVPGGEGVLGVLLETRFEDETKTAFALYSMVEDRVVGRWVGLGVPVDVECRRDVVVISTSSPPALHILSSTLKLLHTLPASSLALYSTPRASSSTSQLQLGIPSPVSTRYAHPHGETFDFTSGERGVETPAHRAELPHAVFALHGRLLAYAVPSPTPSSLRHKDCSLSSSSSGPSPSSVASSSPLGVASGIAGIRDMGTQGLGLGSGIGGIPNTKAELGSAALKVGSGLIGGMRFLGGMALEGVKNRMAANSESGRVQQHERGKSLGAGGYHGGGERGGMFSRSAPTNESLTGLSAEEEKKRRRFSDIQTHGVLAPLSAIKRSSSVQGYGIVVVDLASLTADMSIALDETIKDAEGDRESRLRVVAEFVGSRSQPIAGLGFTPDGCGVYVVPRDGFVTKVFHLRPSPASSPSSSSTSSKEAQQPSGTVLPLYELRRGRVSTAVVESVKAVPDARWTGVVTRNRTLHVFATNPHGGKPHIPSHLEGRMRNNPYHDSKKLVELRPLVRIPGEKLGASGYDQENPPPAMAFTFVDPTSTVLPLSLAPTPLPRSVVGSASSPSAAMPSSLSASPGSPLGAKHTIGKAPRNYQDVLLFDSATGVLGLHRITVEQRPKSELGALGMGMGGGAVGGLVNAAINVSSSLGSKSVSAGVGGAGPLGMVSGSVVSSSVSSQSAIGGGGGGRGGQGGRGGGGVEEGYELTGKVNVVATWDLRKRKGGEEIRGKVGIGGGKVEGMAVGCDEWLAQAELSTFSKSRSSRSRSVYLTHQFSFHTLGEDYHALIRKYRLDVHGTKIDVRKDIPIHAFTSNSGAPTSESFVEGFSPTRTHSGGGVPSSFDEPLASALAGEMEYQPSSNVLPMYPNGPGGGTGGGRSLRNSIPIRKIGDGVSEGLGRIRRAAVRSPKLGPSRVSGGDGGVEDVLLEFDEEEDDFMAPRVVNTKAAQGMDDDVVGTVDEEIWGDGGWDSQDRMAVEEEEQFHAISKTLSPRFEEDVMLPPLTVTGGKASSSASKKSRKARK